MAQQYDPKLDGEDFANQFSRFVNGGGSVARNAAIVKMLHDHPTLQQGMMRFFIDFALGMAKQRGGDLRNQASIELAKKIEAIENLSLPRI